MSKLHPQISDIPRWVIEKDQSKFIQKITNYQKVAFLAGAGISLDPPSNLPTGYQFTRHVLKEIAPEAAMEEILNFMNPERENMRSRGDFLRFEQLVEYMSEYKIDPDFKLLKIYEECDTPNRIHILLAALAVKNNQIFTTNIDSLIEYGFIACGVEKQNIHPIFYRQDYENQLPPNSRPVYKLHGSLFDIRTSEQTYDSLQVTLHQITQSQQEDFTLEYWEKQRLQGVMYDYPLILLGYSGLDDFDIIPTLKTISTSQPLLWITHDHNRSVEDMIIHKIGFNQDDEEELVYDRVANNLIDLASSPSEDGESRDIYRIYVNTHQFIEYLTQFLLPDQYEQLPRPSEEKGKGEVLQRLNEILDEFYIKLVIPDLIAGRIFTDFGNHAKGLTYYQNALNILEAELDTRDRDILLGILYGNIGYLLQITGNNSRAVEYFNKGIKTIEKYDDSEAIAIQASLFNNLAFVSKDIGPPDHALEILEKALSIAQNQGDKVKIALRLNNIGLFLSEAKNFDTAQPYFEEALQLFDEIGDLKRKSAVLNNLGSVAESNSRFEDAIKYFEDSLKIKEIMGDNLHIPVIYNNLGMIYSKLNNIPRAIENYIRGLELSEQLNDFKGRKVILTNMGELYHHSGNYREAIQTYSKIVPLVNQSGDVREKMYLCEKLGYLLFVNGNYDQAISYIESGLDYKKYVQDDYIVGRLLGHYGVIKQRQQQYQASLDLLIQSISLLSDPEFVDFRVRMQIHKGEVLQALGDDQEALNVYSYALESNDLSNNSEQEGVLTNNIGLLYKRSGNLDKASEYYAHSLRIAFANKNLNAQAALLNNLSHLSVELGEIDQAIEYIDQMLTINDVPGSRFTIVEKSWSAGELFKRINRPEQALKYYYKSVEELEKRDPSKAARMRSFVDEYEKTSTNSQQQSMEPKPKTKRKFFGRK